MSRLSLVVQWLFFAVLAMLAMLAMTAASPAAQAAGLQQGGYEHSVSLDLPPAPRGTGPQLRLVADHQAVDGVLGHGWRLDGLSHIDRVSDNQGVPGMVSADQFMVDGMLLVADPNEAITGCKWRTQIDSRKCFSHDLFNRTWTATRDGWTWTWGEQTNSVASWTGAAFS